MTPSPDPTPSPTFSGADSSPVEPSDNEQAYKWLRNRLAEHWQYDGTNVVEVHAPHLGAVLATLDAAEAELVRLRPVVAAAKEVYKHMTPQSMGVAPDEARLIELLDALDGPE